MNQQEAGVLIRTEAKTWRGTPYKWGGWSRLHIDCRGLIWRVAAAVGMGACYGGRLQTVRAYTKSARTRGFWRAFDSGFVPYPGCLVVYEDATPPASEPGNPEHQRHIAFVFRVGASYSVAKVVGWAFSALNPDEGTHGHALALSPAKLKVMGYIEPDLSLADDAEPVPDPAEPLEPPVVIEPPDFAALYANLRERVDMAIESLEED